MYYSGIVGAISVITTKRPGKILINLQKDFNPDDYSFSYPTVLIGVSTALWDNVHRLVCPSCGNRSLKPNEFCIRCDRWGKDRLLSQTMQIGENKQSKTTHFNMTSYAQKTTSIRNGISRRHQEKV